MSFRFQRIRARARLGLCSLAVATLLWPAVSFGAPEDKIAVYVDQAKLLKIPAKAATIIVGNPLIADVTLQSGGIVVVTGKGYGATNVMAIDRGGSILLDRMIQVEAPTEKLVTVFRGINRETYSCTPVCQQRITLGDGQDYFKSTIDQVGSRNNSAAAVPTDNKQP